MNGDVLLFRRVLLQAPSWKISLQGISNIMRKLYYIVYMHSEPFLFSYIPLKFIYSETNTKFCEISTLLLSWWRFHKVRNYVVYKQTELSIF